MAKSKKIYKFEELMGLDNCPACRHPVSRHNVESSQYEGMHESDPYSGVMCGVGEDTHCIWTPVVTRSGDMKGYSLSGPKEIYKMRESESRGMKKGTLYLGQRGMEEY